MSDPPTDNRILIKFEIHVPVHCGQPVAVVQGVPAGCGAPAQQSASVVPAPAAAVPAAVPRRFLTSVDQPTDTALVKVTGTGATNGAICVTASNDKDPFLRIPDSVYCRIVDVNATVGHNPAADPQAVAATPTGPSGSYLSWRIDLLSTANCAYGASGTNLPYNELVIWRRWTGDGFYTIEFKPFRGLCTNRTNCEPETAEEFVIAGHMLDTVPRALEVKATGFTGTLSGLNGVWQVSRCDRVAPGMVAWATGGDGVRAPRMDLFGKSCCSEPMELRVACSNQRLTYVCDRAQFNPLGANRFVLGPGQRPPQETCIPTEIHIAPSKA